MKRLILTVVMVLWSAVAVAGIDRTILKGSSDTIELGFEVGDIAITDPTVCDYMLQSSRREVYLNAKKEGRSTLTVWDASGSKKELVQIKVVSEISNKSDNSGLEKTAAEIEKAIKTTGISAHVTGGRIVLDGVAYSPEAAARAEQIARLFDADVLNLISVRDTKRNPMALPQVKLDVHFIEIKKNALRSFGINWAPGSTPAGGRTASGGGLLSGISDAATSLIGFVFDLAPKIRFARQKGEARVLENPSLIVKSGDLADFFSGTQVPFYSQESVIFKDVGIKIQAEPIVSSDAVDIRINITVTSPSAGGINRGIDTSTISTTAYCKAGESLALGGIYKNSDAKMYNRIPDDTNTGSSLFTLFLSKDFVSDKSEFVIFVTPVVIDRFADGGVIGANPAGLSFSDWDALDRDITKKRSKKERRRADEKSPEFDLPDSLKPENGRGKR